MKAVSHWLSDGVFSSMNVLQYARFACRVEYICHTQDQTPLRFAAGFYY